MLSGILVDIKKDLKDKFIEVIKSNDFYQFCEMNNKILSDKFSDKVTYNKKENTIYYKTGVDLNILFDLIKGHKVYVQLNAF